MKSIEKISILISALCILFTLVACGGNCDHTYDNGCDAECNECGEIREPTAHDYEKADCDTPRTCKICGATDGEALGHIWSEASCTVARSCKNCGLSEEGFAAHIPMEDDGDCTTAITCKNCLEVLTEARNEHQDGEDDGDCTTPIKCVFCGKDTIDAFSHIFMGEWQKNEDGHYLVCQNDGCNARDKEGAHQGGDATCTKGKICTTCGEEYTDTDLTNHTSNSFIYTDNKDGTHTRLRECCGISEADMENHTLNTDEICACGAKIEVTEMLFSAEEGIYKELVYNDSTKTYTAYIDKDTMVLLVGVRFIGNNLEYLGDDNAKLIMKLTSELGEMDDTIYSCYDENEGDFSIEYFLMANSSATFKYSNDGGAGWSEELKIEVKYQIDVTEAEITLDKAEYIYDGREKTPDVVSVIVDGQTLREGVDYDISYKNNVSVSDEAMVVITFKGIYIGEVEKAFVIKESPTTDQTVGDGE